MEEKDTSIKVWDVFVRVFHWTLVGVMLGLYLTGDEFKNVHINLGYFLIGLVWQGFCGDSLVPNMQGLPILYINPVR